MLLRLQVHRDDEERALHEEPLDGLGDQAEVGRFVAEELQRQQRLAVAPLQVGRVAHVAGEDDRAERHEEPDR